jgi:hypothetical protein
LTTDIQRATVIDLETGKPVEIYQKYRSSNDTLVLDQDYAIEVSLTAELIVAKNAHVHLLMKGDFNRNPHQPSSSFNKHNWYFNETNAVESDSDNKHTAILQYGDPLEAQQSSDLTSWDRTATLENLNSKDLGHSLQGLVLASGGYMRLYDVEGLIAAEADIRDDFFAAAHESIDKCLVTPQKTDCQIMNKWLPNTFSAQGTECCNQPGIKCNSEDRITKINLRHNTLTGPLPSSIGDLVELRILNLQGNQISGTIPESFGKLVSLTDLVLKHNALEGVIPSELGDLSNLTRLLLGSNKLNGTIPASLGKILSLKKLNLRKNQLVGGIPSELGDLSSLTDLVLLKNTLGGVIPSELGGLSNLTRLLLHLNQLNGSIPASLGKIVSLKKLNLRNNQLVGGIPSELGDLSSLTHLLLQSNQLTGSIPTSIGKLLSLKVLSLKKNQLSGMIPKSIGDLDLTTCRVLPNDVCRVESFTSCDSDIPGKLFLCINIHKFARLQIVRS